FNPQNEPDPLAHCDRDPQPRPTPHRYQRSPFGLSNSHNSQFGTGSRWTRSSGGTSSSWSSRGPLTPSPGPTLIQPKVFAEPRRQRGYPLFGAPRSASPIFSRTSGLGTTPPTCAAFSTSATAPQPALSWSQQPSPESSVVHPNLSTVRSLRLDYPVFGAPRPANPIFSQTFELGATPPTGAAFSAPTTAPQPYFSWSQQPSPESSAAHPNLSTAPSLKLDYPVFGAPRSASPIFFQTSELGATPPTCAAFSTPATVPQPYFSWSQQLSPESGAVHPNLPTAPSLTLDDLAPIPCPNPAVCAPRSPAASYGLRPGVSSKPALAHAPGSSYMRQPRVSIAEMIRLRIDLSELSLSGFPAEDEEMRGPGMGDMDVDQWVGIEQDVEMRPPVVIDEDVQMGTPSAW
ncbi:hypothetical protein FRC06_006172, partial [Ceratobasidium sp. 370]